MERKQFWMITATLLTVVILVALAFALNAALNPPGKVVLDETVTLYRFDDAAHNMNMTERYFEFNLTKGKVQLECSATIAVSFILDQPVPTYHQSLLGWSEEENCTSYNGEVVIPRDGPCVIYIATIYRFMNATNSSTVHIKITQL